MASTCFHALFLRSYHWSSEICGVCSMARSDEECVLRIEIYSDKLLLEGTSTVLAVYLRLQLFWKAKKKTGVLKHPLSAVSSAKSNHYQVWWTGLLRLHENKWMLPWSNVSIMALLYFEVTPHFWGKLFWIMICQILFADQIYCQVTFLRLSPGTMDISYGAEGQKLFLGSQVFVKEGPYNICLTSCFLSWSYHQKSYQKDDCHMEAKWRHKS